MSSSSKGNMVGGGYMVNELDDNAMAYGDVFEDLLDFSSDGMQLFMEPEAPLSFDDGLAAAGSAFPPLPDAPSVVAPGASGTTAGIKSDDTAFPCDDIDVAELEWLSNFVEESFSAAGMELPHSDGINGSNMIIKNNNNNVIRSSSNNNDAGVEASGDDNKFELQCRTPSPISVLEHDGLIVGGGNGGGSFLSSSSSPVSSSPTSSSCSSVGGGVKSVAPFSHPETPAGVRGRAPRTKRARPPSGPRSNVLLPIVTSSVDATNGGDSLLMIPSVTNSEAENVVGPKSTAPESEAHQIPPLPGGSNNKKLKIVSSASIAREADNNSQVPVRKCLHCEIQKTPQWRAGPMGPKTLCNACGVRYKSGRLFPEYRPAASPTFVSSLHSNSHKKVVEMRVRASKKDSSAVAPSLPASAKGCELLNYIRSSN